MSPASRFTPEPVPSLEVARRYPFARMDRALGSSAAELAGLFQGRWAGECEQAKWMGRGCFQRLGAGRYLAAKGIGPSPRSEMMRRDLDVAMSRARSGQGGCLRLSTGTRYPLLVKFQYFEGRWEALDPRPEGLSLFRDVIRDAEFALFYLQLGARVLVPLTALRNFCTVPWGEATPDRFESYLQERLPDAISRHLTGGNGLPIQGLRIHNLIYCDLDAGLLIRAARSPYRVADFHSAAADGSLEECQSLATHLIRRFRGPSAADPGRAYIVELARTAALLSARGILHGQLGLHFQNVTLAAELADFDSSVAVQAADCDLRPIPFSGPDCRRAIRRLRAGLARAEETWGISIEPSFRADLHWLAGIGRAGLDETRLAASFLSQIYELYLHGLRIADLLERHRPEDLTRPGTVLSPLRMEALRKGFAEELAASLASHRALAKWYLSRGLERLLDDRLDRRGRVTLYGWTSPEVPVSHLNVVTDDKRQAHIRAEVEGLCAALSAALG